MIKEFYKTDRNLIIELLKEEQIKENEIKDLYELLNENDDELIFHIYTFFNKNPEFLDYEKFSKITGVPIYVLSKIFKERPVKVHFPIANNESSELATAYIFLFDKETSKSSFTQKEELRRIKKLLKERNIGKDFFVIFDKNFKGDSYLLSIAAGIFLPDYSLEDFAFTGKVNEEGEIYPVGYIPKKEEVAKEKGLKLITYNDVSHIDELIYYLGDKPVDIPFLQLSNKTKEEAYISLEKLENKIKEKTPFYSLKKIEKFFELNKEDLLLITGFLSEPEDLEKDNPWIEVIKQFEEKLKKIYSNIRRKKRILHFAGSISTLAFAFGIKIGAKKPVTVYHYQADDYHLVADLSDKNKIRKIKHIKGDLELLEIKKLKENENANEIAVVVWIASHNPYGDVIVFSEGKSWDIFGIETKEYKGNLPLPEDIDSEGFWIEIVREIYTAINKLKNKKYRYFHIFLSSPVPIAFCLGMAVGHFINGGIVYNLNLSEKRKLPYYSVFKIEDDRLKSIF